jgi:hypothetical protein
MKNVSINKQIRINFLKIRMSLAITDINIKSLSQFVNKLSEDERQQFTKYPLLWRMRFAFWNLAILELYKIYKEDESNSLIGFINSLINNYKRIKWQEDIELGELKNYKSVIVNLKDMISKIITYRNKVVAHSDKTKPSVQLHIDELIDLLDNAKTIYDKINYSLNDTMTNWDSMDDNYDLALIKNICKYNQIREMVTIAKIQKKPTMETKILMKIINNKVYVN